MKKPGVGMRFLIHTGNWAFLNAVHGVEHVPKTGPYIIAANHVSFPDAWLVGNMVYKRTGMLPSILSRDNFWLGSTWTRLVGTLFDVLFIDWRDPSEVLTRALKKIRTNEIVGFFPEASRNYNQRTLLRGKTGMIRLALAGQVPIIPIGYRGPNVGTIREYWKEYVLGGKRAELHLGAPIFFDDYYGAPLTREPLYTLTDNVMKEIARLSDRTPVLHE